MNGLRLKQKLRAVQVLRWTQAFRAISCIILTQVKPVKYTYVTDVTFRRQQKSTLTQKSRKSLPFGRGSKVTSVGSKNIFTVNFFFPDRKFEF